MIKFKNIFHTGINTIKRHIYNKNIPVNVMFSVTNRCNGNCIYCKIPQRSNKELTTEEIFSLIDQLNKLGTKRLGLWGGEPLIRDDIGKIIDYAKSKDMFVTMDSNGYLVPTKFDTVEKVDHLILGFDGQANIHDFHRGKGSYNKVIQALKWVKNKVPTWTITVLTKYNLDCIDYILQKADELDFLTTFQVLHHNEILGNRFANLLPPNNEYRKAISKLIKYKIKGAPIASSLDYLRYVLNWPDYHTPTLNQRVDRLRCQAGRLFCNIDVDGCVYPCSLLIGEMKAENVLKVGFKQAFEKIGDFRCKSCDASCYIEYNYLYNLHFPTILDWLSSFSRTKKFIKEG